MFLSPTSFPFSSEIGVNPDSSSDLMLLWLRQLFLHFLDHWDICIAFALYMVSIPAFKHAKFAVAVHPGEGSQLKGINRSLPSKNAILLLSGDVILLFFARLIPAWSTSPPSLAESFLFSIFFQDWYIEPDSGEPCKGEHVGLEVKGESDPLCLHGEGMRSVWVCCLAASQGRARLGENFHIHRNSHRIEEFVLEGVLKLNLF